jgi:hypothetical protein
MLLIVVFRYRLGPETSGYTLVYTHMEFWQLFCVGMKRYQLHAPAALQQVPLRKRLGEFRGRSGCSGEEKNPIIAPSRELNPSRPARTD